MIEIVGNQLYWYAMNGSDSDKLCYWINLQKGKVNYVPTHEAKSQVVAKS